MTVDYANWHGGGHNSLSALGAFLPEDWQEIIVKDAIGHNSLSALGAFLPIPRWGRITMFLSTCHNSLSALGAFLPLLQGQCF